MPTATTPPVLFVLWHRPGRGGKWQKVGQYGSRAEAVNAVDGKGDWWIAPLTDPRLAGDPDATDRQQSVLNSNEPRGPSR